MIARVGMALGALLTPPPTLPKTYRDSAGQMTGADAQSSLLALYDVAGQIRASLIALQAQVRLSLGTANAKSQ